MLMGQIPSSQAAAERLIARGCRGMIVASFVPGATADDVNVVFWDWSDVAPNKVSVIDPHGRLPRDQSSWSSRA
jgi:RES domain-containing protein